MNYCATQQSTFAACEEMMSSYSISDKKDAVVCPKPRRIRPMRPLRWHVSPQQDLCDSRAGANLLDIILTKGVSGCVDQSAAQVGSSPPFFCVSPPSRVSNPLIQDARFGDEKVTPVSPWAIPNPSGLGSSSARKRANFGHNPAVRVEGFDCLDRDRRNCSIPAFA